MRHETLIATSIRARMTEAASAALKAMRPFDFAIEEALDKAYGRGQWFLFWDEDMAGKPIRGTISLGFGNTTLVIG